MQKKFVIRGRDWEKVRRLISCYRQTVNASKIGKHRRGTVGIADCVARRQEDGTWNMKVVLGYKSAWAKMKDPRTGQVVRFQKSLFADYAKLFRKLSALTVD